MKKKIEEPFYSVKVDGQQSCLAYDAEVTQNFEHRCELIYCELIIGSKWHSAMIESS